MAADLNKLRERRDAADQRSRDASRRYYVAVYRSATVEERHAAVCSISRWLQECVRLNQPGGALPLVEGVLEDSPHWYGMEIDRKRNEAARKAATLSPAPSSAAKE